MHDVDGSGYISMGEYLQVLKSFGIDEDKLKDEFKGIDLDRKNAI